LKPRTGTGRLPKIYLNEKKSMNTHLHLMEAYTALYRVWKDEHLKDRLYKLVDNFLNHILNQDTHHFILFQNELWQSKSNHVSFGHDIEGSWLLCEAAEILGDTGLVNDMEKTALKMVDITMKEGFSQNFTIYADRDGNGNVCDSLEWWQQAEAVVGFVNAYQVSDDDKYLDWAVKCWDIIEQKIVDRQYGEWYFGILPGGKPDHTKYKVSEWKGPYHNSRTCMEILKRLNG